MNFNYDIVTWIDFFIGAFVCCLGVFFIGKILLNKKIKEIKFYCYILLILLSMLTIFNSLIFDNVFKVFITFIVFFLIYKFIFRVNIINSLLYAIASYICFIFSEVTVSYIMILFMLIFKGIVFADFIQSIIINVIISLLALFYAFILKNKINIIIKKINKYSIFYVIISGIITIIGMATSLFRFSSNNCIVDYKFVLNIFTFGGFLVLTIVLLKQYFENNEISNKYILLKDYLKTSADLVEKYSSTVHKYKNNLIAIKGYLKTNINEAEEYIDNLLDSYDNKKYNWFRKINYIQVDSIRYLIYYKLSKAESENLKIMVDVSNDIKKCNNEIFSIKESNLLLEIIGEYFDNAIYASSESKKKELNFMLYEENNQLKYIFANTYKDSIDLSMIRKNGYTTKGKGHGLGLYDIDRSLKNNEWIRVSYELIDNYFVVNLYVDLKGKNK